MAASSIAECLPWERMFSELRDLEEARRSSKTPQPLALKREAEAPAQFQHLSGLPAIIKEASAVISAAQERAEMLEQQVAAVVQSSKAQVQAAEAASKALERDANDANERIRALELRAQTAEERVRELEARLESARRVLDDTPVAHRPLVQRRPNPEVTGPQPIFERSPVRARLRTKGSFNRPLPS